MKYRIKILETLNRVKEGTNKIPVNNLESIVNFNNDYSILGGDFLELLIQMKEEELVESDLQEWNYSITKKGIEYLEKNFKQ